MPLGEAAGALSHSTETVETETIEETTTTTTTTSGTETVNVTVTKVRTRTTKITEITPRQPALLLPSPHAQDSFPARSSVSGQNRSSDSSATPTHVRAVVPQTPSHISSKSSQPVSGRPSVPTSRNAPKTGTTATTPTRSSRTPKHRPAQPIHPDDIELPSIPVNEFYVVIVGQEPGIFYNWNDAAARVLGVSKNIHFKCATFQEALRRYKDAYYCNEVKCVPNPGTRFLSQSTSNASSSSRSPPFEESVSDVEYWKEVVDLSEEMSNIHVA
ncbi:hypothetical protein EDD15DRAFT_2200318 [Pisolithus albus]|nr:hypothetical protein EDD15DRAFT_2200318 [Pisolithus albus]